MLQVRYCFSYDGCWISRAVREHNVRARFLQWDVRNSEGREVVELWSSREENLERAIAELGKYPHITSYSVREAGKGRKLLEIIFEPTECPFYELANFSNGNRTCPERVDYNGNLYCIGSLKKIRKAEKSVAMLRERFGIVNVRTRRTGKKPDQLFLLKEAFERGYFDVPRRTSLSELQEALDIPKSTLSVNLRRMLREVVELATK